VKDHEITALLERAGAGLLLGGNMEYNELTLDVVPDKILDALRALKAERFERLSTVTVVDRYPMEPRFELAEEVALARVLQHYAFAGRALEEQLDAATQDDVERVTRIAGVEQLGSVRLPQLGGTLCERAELALVQEGEQRDLGELLA
jgi:NADH:ubiquinone oxidoreductase subunit C